REKGDLEAMREAYDQVLARAPDFERAGEMSEGYFEYAKKHATGDRERAILALRRADRLTTDESRKKRLQSLLLSFEASRSAERGVADKSLLRRAVELDPENDRARDELAGLSRATPPSDRRTRFAIAGVIGLSALAGVLFILLRPRTAVVKPAPEKQPERS
ncbi:MAG TPA: hypothetical protein VF103_04195, partial [Polyangiaceae bacterium]